MSEPFAMLCYRAAVSVARPFLPVWLNHRVHKGKELGDRVGERLGRPSEHRPSGHLIWCHAASVGESKSVIPLLDVVAPHLSVVLTTGTVASANQLAGRLSSKLIHQFAPLDHPALVERFLDYWRPCLALRVESEIWPITITELKRRQIPIVMLNGRMSPGSAARWRNSSHLSKYVFGAIDLALTQTQADGDAFRELGASNVAVSGNLKAAAPTLPDFPALRDSLARAISGRPRWLAASIHPGEAAIVMRTQIAVREHVPNALAVVVPRHPDKAGDMAMTAKRMGLNVALRSSGETIRPQTDVYIADTMGELGVMYRLCPVVYVGKSLAVGGGQNPIEPAQLGCALLMGPDMSNFKSEAKMLLDAGGAQTVASEKEFERVLVGLLTDDSARTAMSRRAAATTQPNRKPLEDTLTALRPFLSKCGIDEFASRQDQ